MNDDYVRAILEKLPPKPRSTLEPYVDLIRRLRARNRSYREIVEILRDRCDLRVSLHAVYQFVRRRELQKQRPKIRRSQQQVARREPNVERPRSIPPPAPEDSSDAVRKRIAAIKAREAPLPTERKEFAFNENEPLQLINKHRKEPEDGRD